jgi:hypothetical protein
MVAGENGDPCILDWGTRIANARFNLQSYLSPKAEFWPALRCFLPLAEAPAFGG